MVAVLVLVAAVRLRLSNFPLERDEGEYAYAGQLLLQGIPPYQLAYNMKFPGTYAAYAVMMAVFGETPAGIHFGVLCVTTLTAWMLYRFGRRLFDEATGAVAATTYAVLAASPQMFGLAGHATHFCALFATAGLCLLWPFGQHINWKRAAAGGLMFGLAVLMKQPAALLCLWGLALLVVDCRRQREIPLRIRLSPCVAFCLGVTLPFALTCLVLWRAGTFTQFWFWTITYAREYVSEVPWSWVPGLFFRCVSQIIEKAALLWLVAAAGLGLVCLNNRFRGARRPLLGFAAVSFLATCPGFYFRTHYFLLTLPAVALVAGCAVHAAHQICREKTRSPVAVSWPVCIYWLILALTVFANREIWFQVTPVQAARIIYLENPFAESEVVSAFIRTNSPPDARVAVLGSEPQIYFLSQRRSATGYIYMYPLMEPQPFADRMQQDMIREIESARPEYVISVLVLTSWLSRPHSDTRLSDWWSHSYETNLTLIGAVAINPTNASHYFWGTDVTNCPMPPKPGMLIYRRKVSE